MEPVAGAPSARGPIESTQPPVDEASAQSTALPTAPVEGTVSAAQTPAADAVSQTASGSVDAGGHEQVGQHTPGSNQALPQVQTAEPPRAVAQLQGYILEVPARQASNDDDQSSVH
jgi:hypothetical protein